MKITTCTCDRCKTVLLSDQLFDFGKLKWGIGYGPYIEEGYRWDLCVICADEVKRFIETKYSAQPKT